MRSRPADGGNLPRLRSQHEGGEGETPAALLFAFLIFFLVAFLSTWQLTARPRAMSMIEAGVVSATDLDRLLEDNYDDLRTFVATSDEETFAIPGFPLDVRVTADEVANSTREEFRTILLQRASASVYDHGADAFDTSGSQSIGRFSSEGALQFVLNGLTGSWHGMAQWAALILAILAASVALYVLRREDGHRRFVLLGAFTAAAGIMGCLVTFAMRSLIGRFGGSDPFSEDLREIANAALSVPMTNYVVVAVSGLIVAAIGLALKAANKRFPGDSAPDDGNLEPYDYREPEFGDRDARPS